MKSAIPYESEYDPAYSSEGSLDPLGLYPIADRLATTLVPGVRERMLHPRFLTSMAVGSVICSDFGFDEIAKDGVSEPWMVYEWYVVQAMVRTFFKGGTSFPGVPGIEKATSAYNNGIPLNVSRYLKTATVFGFHGVYRTLADELHIVDRNDQLGEVGDVLVRAWEKEQKMSGFYSVYNGPGRDFRNRLFQAVKDGLQKGEVSRAWGWGFFKEIGTRLAHQNGGRKELDVIFNALVEDQSGFRAEVINFLRTTTGHEIWLKSKSEKDFHEALIEVASYELKQHLLAIQYYERFSRLLDNTFETCLYAMSQNGSATTTQLATLGPVKKASQHIKGYFEEAHNYLEPVGEALKFYDVFAPLSEEGNPKNLIHLLFQHHKNIQRRKPPSGKRPWAGISSGENYLLYSKYQRKKAPRITDEYVSFYRTNSLLTFLKDLRMLDNG